MSRLDELIAELCPDGVEYKPLLSIADVLYGFPCNASMFNSDGVGAPLARIRDVKNGYSETYTTENVPQKYIINMGDLLIGMDGNFHVSKWKQEGAVLCQRVCKVYSKDEKVLLNSFLTHLMKPIILKIENNKQSGTVKHLLDKDIKAISIPLPPLPVQYEIVRILDCFTELTAELTAELAARKKQYEYYKTILLSSESTNTITLDELFDTRNGFTPSKSIKSFWENGVLPWFRMEDIRENGRILSDALQHITMEAAKNNPFPANSIIVSTSATIGEHALILCDFLSNQRFTCLTLKNKYEKLFDLKFLFYYCYKLDEYCINNLNQGNFASVDMVKFRKFTFPIIPFEEQKRIVNILDRFDKLCNDISDGLPAEIAARQKQYEYYRDKLLTFPKAEVSQ